MRETVMRQRLTLAARWACYGLLLVVCYVLQTGLELAAIAGIRPLWLAATCLTVCCFEDAFPSALYGMFAGLLWDLSANRLVGFYASTMLVCCFVCSCVIQLSLRRRVYNVCAMCLVCVFAATGLDYLFSYVLFSLPQRGSYFTGRLLPTVGYTVAVCALLYSLCSLICRIGRQES